MRSRCSSSCPLLAHAIGSTYNKTPRVLTSTVFLCLPHARVSTFLTGCQLGILEKPGERTTSVDDTLPIEVSGLGERAQRVRLPHFAKARLYDGTAPAHHDPPPPPIVTRSCIAQEPTERNPPPAPPTRAPKRTRHPKRTRAPSRVRAQVPDGPTQQGTDHGERPRGLVASLGGSDASPAPAHAGVSHDSGGARESPQRLDGVKARHCCWLQRPPRYSTHRTPHKTYGKSAACKL